MAYHHGTFYRLRTSPEVAVARAPSCLPAGSPQTHRWLGALLGLLLAPAAWGAPALSGRFVLDSAASQPIEPLLKAQGVSWALRKAAASARPTLSITQSGDTVTIQSQSPMGQTTEVFTADGKPHATASASGKPATWTSRWEGETLVSSRTVAVGPDQTPGTLSLERRMVGEQLHQTVVLTLADGTTHRVLRVFSPTGG